MEVPGGGIEAVSVILNEKLHPRFPVLECDANKRGGAVFWNIICFLLNYSIQSEL